MVEVATPSRSRVLNAAVPHALEAIDDALAAYPGGPEGDAGWAAGLVQRYDALRADVALLHRADAVQLGAWLDDGTIDRASASCLRSQHHAVDDVLREGAEAMARLAAHPTAATAREVRAVLGAVRDVVEQHLAHEERLLVHVWQG